MCIRYILYISQTFLFPAESVKLGFISILLKLVSSYSKIHDEQIILMTSFLDV